MPVSTVTFGSFNADPLPDPALIDLTSISYGNNPGTGGLDTKDEAGSYASVGDWGAGSFVVTCRPIMDPPIPAGAFIRPSFPTDVIADFEATLMEVAFATAPTMPDHLGVPLPAATAPTFLFARASDGHLVARGIAEGRYDDNPPWGAAWWDETDSGVSGGPPAVSTFTGLIEPGIIATLDPSDYLCIFSFTQQLWISQFVGQITWLPGAVNWHTVGGHFASPGGVSPQILTPGVGWVDIVDGPA